MSIISQAVKRLVFALAAAGGAALVGENSGFSGEATQTIQDAIRNGATNVRKFGVKADGVTNDTVAWQKAADSGAPNLVAPSGTTICGPVFWRAGTVLTLTAKTVVQAPPGMGTNDCMWTIQNVDSVVIHGNGGRIVMLKAEYISGEQRHGVCVLSATNVRIINLRSDNSGGDGYYVGSYGTSLVPSQNIVLENCKADNNRRQGLSICGVVGMWVNGGHFSNTNGTSPAAGIDVEPNAGDVIQDVHINNPRTSGNYGCGIIVVPTGAGAAAGGYFSLSITGHESINDATGLGLSASLRFEAPVTPAYQIDGKITVRNCRSYMSNNMGMLIGNYSWNKCPELDIDGLKITNPGVNTADNTGSSGVVMSSGFSVDIVNNIKMRNVFAEDTRAVKRMFAPYYLGGAGYRITNVSMDECDGAGSVNLTGPFVYVGKTDGLVVRQGNPRVVALSGNNNVYRYSGLLITQATSGILTLPVAADYVGMELEFLNTLGTTMQIRPTGDIILQYGLTAGNDLVLRKIGSYVKLKSMGAAGWRVMAKIGSAAPLSYLDEPVTVYVAAMPTTGAWVVGDRAVIIPPVVGSPKAWTRKTTGSGNVAVTDWSTEGNF